MDGFQRDLVALLPRLRRLARALTRNLTDADDLVQVTVTRALARSDRFQRGSRLDSWMFTIMRNAWIDEVRSTASRASLIIVGEDVERTGDDLAAVRAMEARADFGVLHGAMQRLPAEQRLAVALVLVDGLSYQAAAEVMGVPMGTLTSRLVRGRAALAAHLEGEEGAR
ncbi:RNA polymerase sigma factor [Phenylobacterium koreense]|uniref:RNA polymerase sigma-70 factor (ECF subfamily) n=1 Tax=Phenylobacterium koreense TaxID=266125 RepID=A0ABV2ELC5_9CAUL